MKRPINMLGSYCQESDHPGFSTSPDAFGVIPYAGGSRGKDATLEGEAVVKRPGVEAQQPAGVGSRLVHPFSRHPKAGSFAAVGGVRADTTVRGLIVEFRDRHAERVDAGVYALSVPLEQLFSLSHDYWSNQESRSAGVSPRRADSRLQRSQRR